MMRRIVLLSILVPCVALSQTTPGKVGPIKLTLAAATATPMTMLSGTVGYSACVATGEATVYMGFATTLDATNGVPIAAGTCQPVTVTYQSASTGTIVYLYSTAGTGTNKVTWNGTR